MGVSLRGDPPGAPQVKGVHLCKLIAVHKMHWCKKI